MPKVHCIVSQKYSHLSESEPNSFAKKVKLKSIPIKRLIRPQTEIDWFLVDAFCLSQQTEHDNRQMQNLQICGKPMECKIASSTFWSLAAKNIYRWSLMHKFDAAASVFGIYKLAFIIEYQLAMNR